MATLDEFFRNQPKTPTHPRLRSWKAQLSQGAEARLELHRPTLASGLAQTEMVLHITSNGQPQPLEIVPWDDDLNTGLIRLGVRCIDADQEADRFAIGLRGSLRKAEREFGDGYLNAVLLDLIRDSDLPRYREIAEIFQYSTALEMDRDGRATRSYNICREIIADAIAARAHELSDGLHYTEDEAKPILVQALARYLDERFSVTSRRRLGLL